MNYYGREIDTRLFAPHFTPVQMLEQGVFGGGYFNKARDEDMLGLGKATALAYRDRRTPLAKRNAYGVKSGMSLIQWIDRGWIFPEDPLGWFHWYCRWHAGRQHPRDAHQMARWISYGERWGRTAKAMSLVEEVSPVVKQGLLHWAYDPIQVIQGD